jgi:MtN3 and saliva related transmembrane protein
MLPSVLGLREYITSYQEYLGYIAGVLGALSFLPQLIKIWQVRSVKDISTSMYVIYGISVILWLFYGVIIGSMPLVLAELLTLILVSAILMMKYIWK